VLSQIGNVTKAWTCFKFACCSLWILLGYQPFPCSTRVLSILATCYYAESFLCACCKSSQSKSCFEQLVLLWNLHKMEKYRKKLICSMYTGISWIFVNVAPNFILSIPIVLSVS